VALGDLDCVIAWLMVSGYVNAEPATQPAAAPNYVAELIIDLYAADADTGPYRHWCRCPADQPAFSCLERTRCTSQAERDKDRTPIISMPSTEGNKLCSRVLGADERAGGARYRRSKGVVDRRSRPIASRAYWIVVRMPSASRAQRRCL